MPRISDREELVYLLAEASELEHALCCCYLFAAFSLKRDQSEDLSASELDAVKRWERTIAGVAVQEMLHLALASNLLTALGAAPHLRRPNFPIHSKYLPLSLRRFEERTLDHFIFIERPDGMVIPDAPGFEAPLASADGSGPDGVEPVDVPFATVGHLYRDIEEGFKALCAKYGEERVFIGPPRAQATAAYFPFRGLMAVTDMASAVKAIEEIVEQGEGLRGDIENSHYARFLSIRGELDRLRAGRPEFEPARPVMENPVIEHPDARAVGELFNASYALMVEMLMRFFSHTEESDEELSTLVATAVGMMQSVVKPLGPMLTSMPAGAAGDGARAGPGFEFYASIDLLPHRDAAWAIFDERFTELAEFSGQLAARAGLLAGLDRVHARIESLAANLRRHRRAPVG
ncbi:MAG TPA: ferritin-like protein [Candidatus Dormibacteraeota bacterium]|nr:ferritin-like protein [Candidatus Dormibacteraeota bacterium]